MQQCPKCASRDVHRSRSRNRWERLRGEITRKRPHRCYTCRWRGWGEETGPTFTAAERAMAERAIAPEPPNLEHAAPPGEESRRNELSLAELDALVPLAPGSTSPERTRRDR